MELAGSFLVHTLFLLTPGTLACKLARALRGDPHETDREFIVDALLFSSLGYLLAGVVPGVTARPLAGMFLDEAAQLDWRSIGTAIIAACATALLFAWCDTKRWLHRLAVRIGITDRASSDDVWSLFLEPSETEWHFLRDHARELLYFGHVHAYSESEKRRELWLKQVKVYDGDGSKLLYTTDDLYWAGPPDDMTLESPSERRHDS